MSFSLRSFFRRSLFGALAALGIAVGTVPAHAQQVHFRTVEDRPEGRVVEVTATWPLPLQATVDSLGAASLSRDVAAALAAGMYETSEAYELPAYVLPRVQVLASDYDEVTLPPASGAEAVLAELTQPEAEMVGLGTMQHAPVATLVARLLAYDEARGALRRYRRLLVAVDYGTSAAVSKRVEAASGVTNPHLQVAQSVLADGVIYKIPVTREGIYRIDREFIAQLPGLGLSPDNIDPATVKVYGNGGAPLPALNSAPRPADLVETPVYVQGGGDGAFQSSDYILFYGAAPRGWRYDAGSGSWQHYVNPFSSENYYFIKIGGATSQRVGDAGFPNYADARSLSQVTGRYVRDFEEFMWSKENGTGLDWMSRTIRSGNTRPVLENVALPGFGGGEVQYQARVAIRSNPVATVLFTSGGSSIGQARARSTTGQQEYDPIAVAGEYTFAQNSGARLDVTMELDANAHGTPEAAIDWIRVFYPQALRAEGDTLRFATPAGEAGRFDFSLTGFSGVPQVWDVTEPGTVRRLGVQRSGDAYRVQVEVTDPAQPREIVAFVEATAQRPSAAGVRVANQNLHGMDGYPSFVIVTPAAFRASADELADYRRQQGLSVFVADIEQIYNEFSGGLVDMRAVRDFFKFLYDRAAGTGTPFRYALLFGDGQFNFKGLGDETQRPELANWIPPYEPDESLNPEASYTSDDYFGLLDDDEGIWAWIGRTTVGNERVDIGIGRIPAQTEQEAAAVVDKIRHYESAQTFGPWRNRYTFVADDGYNGLSAEQEPRPDLHTQNADVVADQVENQYAALDVEKIYAISYNRVFLNGWRLPEVKRDLIGAINEGRLLVNYSGHGGEQGLAQEEILTSEDAASLENFDTLPVFVTATCSFGWWDLAREQSAAEVLLLNPNGGAVALMTTVRLVFTSSEINTLNVGLNRALNQALFEPDEDGLPRRLGDVIRLTKQTRAGLEGNNRKFNLLGDPTMRIGLPAYDTAVEQVNGTPVAEQPQIRALDRITVSGTVRALDGSVDDGFSGQAHVTVFDAMRRVSLPSEQLSAMPRAYYTVREDLIWRGVVPVSAGRFEATFVVPKDISYSDQPGRITAYAFSETAQANGFTENVIVGGTAENPPDDSEGPRLALFLNDTTFVSGGLTPPDPTLIVHLEDDSGINTVGAGVGHEMLLVIDGDEQNAVDISENFESAPNSYRKGTVTFSLSKYPASLAEGPHTLSVRAWDVINNSATATLDFYLSSTDALVLRNVFNYPNPTSGQTRFIFEHNQPGGTPADVQVRIYTLAGRPVRTLDTDEALPGGVLTSGPVHIAWDGLDEDFDPVASGVYLYKVRVAVDGPDGERRVSERIEKLAVIR